MPEPVVKTLAGAVRGFVEEGQFVFLDVPYAQPPLSELRFAAPAAVSAWEGTRDALTYGPTAPQHEPGWTIIPEPVEPGDDFLNANVYTPDVGDARLPVLVWIHGGGFTAGCNRSPWYRGTRFARDGVVVVTIGYRLGIEGFLEIEGAPSNRAVLDWIAALEWVHDNIAAFGGDPSKVTIAGQSAGSAACVILLANPRAQGLFRGAICQSGVADTRMSPDTARGLAKMVADHLGVAPTCEALASFTPAELLGAHAALGLPQSFDRAAPGLKPFADGDTIPSSPLRTIRDGTAANLPVIAGATAHEINAVRMRFQVDGVGAVSMLEGLGLPAEQHAAYAEHLGVDEPIDTLGQALTDATFRVPTQKLLDARRDAPTYAYDFRWPSHVGQAVGACHCLDVPFAFDNLDAERVRDGLHGPDAPQQLADEMHGAWVRFVTDGDPGWPAHDLERRQTMLFDDPSQVVDDPLRVERGLFMGSRETVSGAR
jgi:para-nitrobenzyl esterase